MTTPDFVNLQEPRDGQTILADTFNSEALIFVQGYTVPFTSVRMINSGVPVAGTTTTSDGSGFFSTPAVNLPIGFRIIQAEAGTPPDTILSAPAFIDIVAGHEATVIDLQAPTSGSTFQADTSGFAHADFSGVTDPNMRVTIWINGAYSGRLAYATASGNFLVRLMPLPVGALNVAAAAGFAGNVLETVTLTILGPPTAPPRPPLLPDMTFTWYMNWLADTIIDGTPQYSAVAAAQVASGAPYGASLRQSLNMFTGHIGPNYITVNAALNELAGTTDLSNQQAAYAYAQIIEAQEVNQ